jgi:aryl-alcohol dehydrogenase-like predicted oxidoreductase
VDAAERLGTTGYELVQNGYSLLQPDAEAEVRLLCHEHDMAFLAFSPLAGGVLTGKYRRDEPPAVGTRLDLRPEGFDELMTPDVHDALDVLAATADDLGIAPGALALAWLIHREDVTALITGPSRSAPHVELAAQAMELHLADDVWDELTETFRTATRPAP